MIALGFSEVLGVHRTDNHDTIAATRAKGVARLGTITRARLLWMTRVSFEPEPTEPKSGAEGSAAAPGGSAAAPGGTTAAPLVQFAPGQEHRVV
jgi:hypothetical protein